jgi:DNA-nicking Smr family endonuclease
MNRLRAPGSRLLTSGERELWAQVTRSVAPLRPEPLALEEAAAQPAQAGAKPASEPSLRQRAGSALPRAEPKALAALDPRLKQRLARGRAPIDDRLDLHGLTQPQAHHALVEFIRQARAREARIVLVITGKGTARFSNDRGVLRRLVPQWLKAPALRHWVVGLESASAIHGGEGAFYVRLRRKRHNLAERPTE